MTGTGIFIARDEFEQWPKAFRDDLISRLFGGQPHKDGYLTSKVKSEIVAVTDAEANIEDEYIAELSPKQARDLYLGCSEKTRKAIDTMVSGGNRFFQVADVAAALGVNAPKLTGVWAGITRRTRTITQDPDVYLINWAGNAPSYDSAGAYSDQRGELSELTYQSLSKAIRKN